MASDPALLPLLVGLGLADFSMSPGAIPAARSVVGGLRADDARRLAARVLRLATVDDIERCLARGARPAAAPACEVDPAGSRGTGGTSGQR